MDIFPPMSLMSDDDEEVTLPIVALPVLKEKLATPHTVQHNEGEYKRPILDLMRTLRYHTSNVNESAQTVYMLIDDITPAGGTVNSKLVEAYQTITRAKRLLDEAETHLLRYANELDNIAVARAAELASPDPIVGEWVPPYSGNPDKP